MSPFPISISLNHSPLSRLHVNIFDTANQQFTLPTAYFEPRSTPPTDSSPSFTSSSNLVFNYESTPFAFWVTRRSEPDAAPLFDTRVSSLPPTPIPAFFQPTEYNPGSSTGFDGFPLVFEEQYLQVTGQDHYSNVAYMLITRMLADFCPSTGREHLRARRSRRKQRFQEGFKRERDYSNDVGSRRSELCQSESVSFLDTDGSHDRVSF